ncbi:hypothetical protein RC102_000992 [Listeria monocytogenes]|nr:hypothetical protein [Listeria monocytogenes]EKZ0289696.1 hypothetical protein [Listeria monocytogenes]
MEIKPGCTVKITRDNGFMRKGTVGIVEEIYDEEGFPKMALVIFKRAFSTFLVEDLEVVNKRKVKEGF